MDENMNTTSLEDELRRQREEEEARLREEQRLLQEKMQAAQDAANADSKLGETNIGPSNRPFTKEQSDLLKERKAVRATKTKAVEKGELTNLPSNLEPMREQLEKKNENNEIISSSLHNWRTGREIQIDFSSIKDIDQAVYFAPTLDTEEDRKKYFKEYARRNNLKYEDVLAYADDKLGTKVFAFPQSNAGKRNLMLKALDDLDLFDIAGEDVDVYSADFDVLAQSLTNIADKETREAGASYLESLTKIPGSPFYGRKFDKDDVYYRNNASLPENIYKKEIEGFGGKFYGGENAIKQDAETYLAMFEQIHALYGENPYAFRQMESALKDAYEKQTGYAAPKASALLSLIEERNAAGSSIEEEEEKGFWDWLFGNKKEEKPKAVSGNLVEGRDYTMREGYIASAGPAAGLLAENAQIREVAQAVADAPVAQPTQNKQSETPAQAAEQPAEASQPSGRWIDGRLDAHAEKVKRESQPMMSEAEVLKYLKAGRGDELSEANYAQVKDVWENDTFRSLGLFGVTPTEKQLYDQDHVNGHLITEEERLERAFETTSAYQLLGKTLGGVADTLNSGAMPEDISLEGQLLLGDIINQADRLVRSGNIHIPQNANKYEYAISQSPALQKKAEQLTALQARVNAIQANKAIEAAHDYDRKVDSAERAFISGRPLTQEQVMLLTENAKTISSDQIYNDKARRDMRFMLGDNSPVSYYKDDGKFWSGNSAAAEEGKRLLETQSVGKYDMYKYELREVAYEVIDDLANTAYGRGMTLEQFMSRTGIGIDQVMDMAYNRIAKQGAQIQNDPELQQIANDVSSGQVKSVGLGTALVYGSKYAAADNRYHFMNAPYAALDAFTYDERIRETYAEYDEKYKTLAAAMRRKDLIDYANSGEMPAEDAKALIEDVENASDIFDIAFEIDPGWLASSWREAMWEFKKDADALEAVAAEMPDYERAAFMGASNVVGNIEPMVYSAVIGGAATALRAPAFVARTLAAVPHSLPMFSRSYEENSNAGLSSKTSAWMAFGETAVMSYIESFGAEKTVMDSFFGSALARNSMEATLRKTGTGTLNVIKAMARTSAMDYGVGEAGEEVVQTIAGAGLALFRPAIKGVEEGTITTPGQFMGAALQELKETDPVALSKEASVGGAMGFVMGALVSLPVVGMNTYKAVTNVNLQKQYESIDIASQITHGEIPASDENIGRFIDAMRKDSKDPKFVNAYNKSADAAMQTNALAVSAMSGAGHDMRVLAIAESSKASDYEAKAEAARKAVESNKKQYAIACAKAAEGNKGDAVSMEGFRTAWAKAQTTETENTQAAAKAKEKAAEYTAKWLHECQAVAKAFVKTTKQSAMKQMINLYRNLEADDMEADVAEAEANADALEAEAFIEENYKNHSDTDKDHIREIWGVPVNTKKEVAPQAATGAENAQVTQAEVDVSTAPQAVSETAETQPAQTVAQQEQAPTQPAQTAETASPAPANPVQARTGEERLVENRKRRIKAAERFAGQVTRRFGVDTEIVPANDERLKLPAKDKNGNARYAPALYDRKADKIIISENATQGDVIRAKIVHELTHRTEGTEAYKEFAGAVLKAYYKTDENINAARNARKSTYAKAGIKLDEAGIDSELVAYATEQLIGGDQEMIDRIVNDNPSVARRIMDAIKAILDRLTGVKGKDVDDLRAVEQMFKKALDETAKKRAASYQQAIEQSNHPASVQFSVEQLAEATGLDVRRNDDGVPYTLIDKDGKEVTNVTPEMIKKTPIGNLIDTAVSAGTVNKETANAQLQMFSDLATLAAQYKDQAMVWEIAGSQLFSAIKSNSDTQYGTTVDFGTICAKTQAIVDVMSETMLKLGRGLSRDEVIKTYRETANVGYNVPCPVCYVFSRWMGVPSLLNNIAEYQDRFTAMSDQEVKDYVSSVEERYAKGSDKPEKEIGNAKIDLEKKLDAVTREMQKRLEKGLEMGELADKARSLEAEYKDVEAYNWVTQALCQRGVRDENGQVVLDTEFEPTPKEILFDLRRTSEFSLYKKNWTYRSTRGAGMGKSILPYSGARIGDTVKGNKDRWSTEENPFLSGDMKGAARSVANARRRMAAQNLIGGQRFQSTSDYRPEWGIDYMMTFLEMQAIGAKGQLYTKVIEAVDMFATAGIETNLSIMGKGNGYHLDENGKPVLGDDDFSNVTGIDFREARKKTKMYDNVQMILVGLNDTHIRLALADDDITFVIPWHSSGNSEEILSELMGAVGEKLETGTDYTKTQSDKKVAKPNAQQKAAADLRMRILTGELGKSGLTDADRVVLDTNPYLADLYRRFYEDESATETYGVKLSSKQASQVFPYEYWDTSLTIEDADENGRRFREYCESIGLEPRFPQFANDPGYWKLLIDRRMYNRDGTYHHPKTIDVTGVSIDSVAQSVGEVKYGDDSRTDQAVQATIDNIKASIPAETYSGDVQYSIDLDESNWPIVKADRDFVLSDNHKDWGKQINAYIRDVIREKGEMVIKTLDGDEIILDAKSQRKAKDWMMNGDANDNRVRKNASAHLDEVVAVSEDVDPNAPNAPDEKGLHEWSKDGWRYREAVFEDYNGRRYLLTLSVGMSGDNRTVYNIGDVKEIEKRTITSVSGQTGRVPGSPAESEMDSASPRLGSFENIIAEESGADNRQFSLPDDDHLRAEIDAWRSNPDYNVENKNIGKRQFANRTLQNNQYIPDYIKQEFLNNPANSDYSRESNMSMLNAAWNSEQAVGYEAARDRLVNQETKFDTYDNAVALLLMRQALHDGDLDTLMAVATKYNAEGTDQGKALQIRSLMRKMTPTGFAQMVIQDVSRKVEERDTKKPGEKRRRERESKKIKEDLNLGALDDTTSAEALERGESIVIDKKFGAGLNEAKRVLIKEFGLEKTTRPGDDFYNWATTKQRMLEDILTTDDIWAKDSYGMDLVDRLVRMKHGDIVLTKADLEYITDQMAIFDRLADKNSREADLALARAHEAQGNVNGATGKMKRRTWRYVSMLLSAPSAIRNAIGNVAQSIPNAIADGIAVEFDRILSGKTGERTRAHLDTADRIKGWAAFREETFNTFRDYFVDKTITQHGEGRYNQSQLGRVYQTQTLETLRHLQGLLMSVGDRNFWKKKFFNSLAEQQRLAEINGTEFDVEAAMETAEAEANYATFNEDSKVRELMSALVNHIPFLDYLMPFVGVPTNIIKRQIEFSPIGIATTAFRHGLASIRGEAFDQRAFVDGMARGLTGSAMMMVGVALFKAGVLKLGTKEEDDDKSYGIRTAQGDQYGVYFTIGDKNYSITTFSPAASALVAGAFAADAMKDNDNWIMATLNGMTKNINEIFDASYMSALGDVLNTSNGKSVTDNIVPAIASAMVTQNIPAPLTHLASSLDPYVRDTKDKDALMEVLKTTINKMPGARTMLPEKVDVAGRAVENTKFGVAAFIDPFTTSYVSDDPALSEMIRLRDALVKADDPNPRAHMASDALSGRRNTLTQNKVTYTVTGEEKEAFRKRYGDLWRNGGNTYDKSGRKIAVQGVEELIASRYYQLMSDKEKAKAIQEIINAAKAGATYEIMNHK